MIRTRIRRDQADRRRILHSGRLWTSTTILVQSIPLPTSDYLEVAEGGHLRYDLYDLKLEGSQRSGPIGGIGNGWGQSISDYWKMSS